MSFDASAGRILITDGASGPTVFDTNQRLLHLLQDPLAGSLSTRASMDWNGGLGAIPSPNIRDQDGFVANVPAATTHLVGLVRYQFGSGVNEVVLALPSGAWFVAGGTHILMQQQFQSADGTFLASGSAVSNIAAVTFYQSGSTIRYKEKIVLWDNYRETFQDRFPSYTPTYRLFPAAFS